MDQAKKLDLAQRQSSRAVLRLWSWRSNKSAEANTHFRKHWTIEKTSTGGLVVTDGHFRFTKYSPSISQYMAKTFIREREHDPLLPERASHDALCHEHAYNMDAPDHFDYQDDVSILRRLQLGKVEVEIFRAPANLSCDHRPSDDKLGRLALSSCSAVNTIKLAECIDEVFQLYMLGDFCTSPNSTDGTG